MFGMAVRPPTLKGGLSRTSSSSVFSSFASKSIAKTGNSAGSSSNSILFNKKPSFTNLQGIKLFHSSTFALAEEVPLPVGKFQQFSLHIGQKDTEAALKSFNELKNAGLATSSSWLLMIKQLRNDNRGPEEIKKLLDEMKQTLPPTDGFWNVLLSAYGKKGDIDGMVNEFNRLIQEEKLEPREPTYNTLIAAFTENNMIDRALEQHKIMQQKGLKLDSRAYKPVIDYCAKHNMIGKMMQYYNELKALNTGMKGDVYENMFEALSKRSLVNLMVTLLNDMEQYRLQPTFKTMHLILDTIGESGNIPLLTQQLDRALGLGYASSSMFITLLKALAAKGDVEAMKTQVQRMREKSLKITAAVHYAFMEAYSKLGNVDAISQQIEQLEKEGYKTDGRVNQFYLQAYAKKGDIEKVLEYEQKLKDAGVLISQYLLGTILNAFYVKGDLKGLFDKAAQIKSQGGLLGHFPYLMMLSSYLKLGDEAGIQKTLAEMKNSNITPNETHYAQLLEFYNNKNDLDGMLKVRDTMKSEKIRATTRTYNLLLEQLSKRGDYKPMLQLLGDMRQSQVKPNSRSYYYLLDAYGKSGDIEGMERQYTLMKIEGVNTNAFIEDTIKKYREQAKSR